MTKKKFVRNRSTCGIGMREEAGVYKLTNHRWNLPCCAAGVLLALLVLLHGDDVSARVDSTFGKDGYVFSGITMVPNDGCVHPCTAEPRRLPSVAVQADGKILVAGVVALGGQALWDYYRVVLLRFNVDGTLDNGFGANGVVSRRFPSGGHFWGGPVVVQADGRIVVTQSAA